MSMESPEYATIQEKFADLVDLLAGNAPVITQFTNHLFSAHLIPESVQLDVASNCSYSPQDRATKLLNSVLATLKSNSRVFAGFIVSIEKAGLSDMATTLRDILSKLTFTNYNVIVLHNIGKNGSILLQQSQGPHPNDVSSIQLMSKDRVLKTIESLHSEFSRLTAEIRSKFSSLIEGGELSILHLARKAGEYLKIPVESLKANNVDELFDKLQSHYDFFNFGILRELVLEYLKTDKIHAKLSQYTKRINRFAESSQLKHIRSAIKEKLPAPITTGNNTKPIIIKLNKRWEMMTLENFRKVLRHYFNGTSDVCSHIYFDYSSVMVSMLIPAAATCATGFVDQVVSNECAMKRIGIFEVAFDNEAIFKEADDINFELSLHQSVKDGDSFAVEILLQLGANPNTEDEGGRTALMLATDEFEGEILNLFSTKCGIHTERKQPQHHNYEGELLIP